MKHKKKKRKRKVCGKCCHRYKGMCIGFCDELPTYEHYGSKIAVDCVMYEKD